MGFIQTDILPLLPYSFLLPFLGALVGGEESILLISMLSANGIIGFKTVFLWSFIGTMASDILWFFGGSWALKLERWHFFSKNFEEIAVIIRKLSKGSVFRSLLMTKFFYGTRILTLFHVRREGTPFPKFIAANALVVLIWTAIIVPFGWLAGKGVVSLGILENIEGLIGIVLLIIVILHFSRKWLNKRLLASQRQSN